MRKYIYWSGVELRSFRWICMLVFDLWKSIHIQIYIIKYQKFKWGPNFIGNNIIVTNWHTPMKNKVPNSSKLGLLHITDIFHILEVCSDFILSCGCLVFDLCLIYESSLVLVAKTGSAILFFCTSSTTNVSPLLLSSF